MKMTLNDYIMNPMGKNNAVLSAITREGIRNNYKMRFDNVLLRENGKINYYLFKDTEKNVYMIHIKVPSEVIEDFYYDVLFRFYTDSGVSDLGRNLEKYYVEFYSNDPAFVYTYAHVFIDNELFIRDLGPKMSKEAIKYKPKERNPKEEVGYVKSIYFAYLFIKQRNLLQTISFGNAPKIDIKTILDNVMHADQKIALRQEAERKRDKRKKIEVDEKLSKRLNNMNLSQAAKSRLVTTTNKVARVKRTRAVNAVKRIGKK